jgi:hypothetical protein
MSDAALTTTEQQGLRHLAQIGEIAMDPTVEPEQKRALMRSLIHAAAEQQIQAATDDDSPWKVLESDSPEARYTKGKMLAFEVAKQELRIVKNWHETLGHVALDIARAIAREQLHLFPADGAMQDLRDILRELLPSSNSRAANAVAEFVDKTMAELEEMGVDTQDIHQIADSSIWMLGKVQQELNKIDDDDHLEPDEKKEEKKRVVTDAGSMSVRDFERKYQDHRIPPIRYYRQALSDESYLVTLTANQEQWGSINRRMRGRWEPTAEALIKPVTVTRLAELLQLEDLPPEAYSTIYGLVRDAVLTDSVCYDVYGTLGNDEHRNRWQSAKYLYSILPSFQPYQIDAALQRLEKWGLIETDEIGSKRLWRVPGRV